MSFFELIVVLGVIALTVMISIPALMSFYQRHQLDSATAIVQGLVRYVRVKAIKEKVAYRIVFRDESGSPPNSLAVQNNASGSFTTLNWQDYAVPEGIRILGSGGTNSMDSLTVSTRGECVPGSVYLGGHASGQKTVTITATCLMSIS